MRDLGNYSPIRIGTIQAFDDEWDFALIRRLQESEFGTTSGDVVRNEFVVHLQYNKVTGLWQGLAKADGKTLGHFSAPAIDQLCAQVYMELGLNVPD